MNFEDLFARYREMGVMAPQPSFDEQLFMKTPRNAFSLAAAATASSCAHLANSDQSDPSMDNVPAWNKTVGPRDKIEPNMSALRLPLANMPTTKFLASSFDEEQDQKQQPLSGADDYDDQELENLLQEQENSLHSSITASPATKQQNSTWNLGLLKKNKSCKDYYKLTSNMIHTLIMGIKEFTDGEIRPSWQVSQKKLNLQQNSNIPCNLLLPLDEVVGGSANFKTTTKESSPPGSNIERERERGNNAYAFQEKETDHKFTEIRKECNVISPNTSEINKPQTTSPVAKEYKATGERYVTKDIDSISELRKMLWRQIVPFTCLAEIEKNIKLAQESRMKLINPRSDFGMHNSNSPKTPSNVATPPNPNNLAQQPQSEPTVVNEHHQELGQNDISDNPDQESASTYRQVYENVNTAPQDEPPVAPDDNYDEETGTRKFPDGEDTINRDMNDCFATEFPEASDDAQDSYDEGKYQRRGIDESVARKPFGQNSNRLTHRADREMRYEDFQPRNRSGDAGPGAYKETTFSMDDVDEHVMPALDGDFELVDRDLDADVPSQFPTSKFKGRDPNQSREISKPKDSYSTGPRAVSTRTTRCKENLIPPNQSSTRSWCIMGGFTTRSQTRLK